MDIQFHDGIPESLVTPDEFTHRSAKYIASTGWSSDSWISTSIYLSYLLPVFDRDQRQTND